MTVKKDLTNMSDREKLKLLMKEAPELFGLIDDFKSKYLNTFLYIVLSNNTVIIYIILYILLFQLT